MTDPAATAVPGPTPDPKRRQKVVLVVFLIVVAGIFGAVYLFTRHAPEGANVGDCVRGTGGDSIETVDCTDPGAEFTVVGRVENKTETEAGLDACDPWPSAEQVYWSGQSGGTGFVLCLAPTKH